MAWHKLFAKWVEPALATDDELHQRNLSRVRPAREPERREQRVLETRSWRDPRKMSCCVVANLMVV